MDELIKIEVNENQEPVISGRALHEFLTKIATFNEFFVAVSKLKVELGKAELKMLSNELDNIIYSEKFGNQEMVYLKDSVIAERTLPCKSYNQREFTEKEMQNYIVKNFVKIFPNYIFVTKEKVVPNVGRIDIFAVEKSTRRAVIIELKKGAKNPNTQLLAYSQHFDNPVLIGSTENITSEADGINYILFKEICNE